MKRRIIVLAACAAYLIAVGCALVKGDRDAALTTTAPTTGTADNSQLLEHPYHGVAMQLQRVDWMDKYKQSIDQIAAVGADTVSLVVDSRQENGVSTQIFLDQRFTPSPEKLIDLIQYAKKKNLRVVLMPIVLLSAPRGMEWRGTLKPDSWDDWFDSYRAMMNQFAWIAQGTGVDVLVVGSELVSSESKTEQWNKTIDEVRAVYKGKLTYSSNWDHYTSIPFWGKLDLMGMNSYYTLGKDKSASVAEIDGNWKKVQGELLPFAKKINRPIIMLEAGWCSLANAASAPWDYTQESEPIDLDLQKRLYEGYFQSWWGNPQLGGFMIWEWPPDSGGPDDRGYTPHDKPAEQVMKEWFAKPWK